MASQFHTLDVGCGPARKTLDILRRLSLSGIRLVGVEPSEHWARTAVVNAENAGVSIEIVNSRWEDIPATAGEHFPVVSLFHSIYGIPVGPNGIVVGLADTIRWLPTGGLCYVTVQSPDSDLYNIRVEFAPSQGNAANYEDVERTLAASGFSEVSVQDDEKQRFYLVTTKERELKDNIAALSFALHMPPTELHRRMSTAKFDLFQREVRLFESVTRDGFGG